MRTLPDYLRKGMRMILVGSNPGDRSARVGHYYAGRGNQFWPIMYESGVIPEPIGYEEDRRILEFGIGMTDLVKRPTRGVDEIERLEFAEGRVLLCEETQGVPSAGDRFQWEDGLRKILRAAVQAGLA